MISVGQMGSASEVDKDGNTIAFLLRAHRDKTAARRYFEKSITQNGAPETVNIDKSGGFGGGNKGSISAHSSSSMIGAPIPSVPLAQIA